MNDKYEEADDGEENVGDAKTSKSASKKKKKKKDRKKERKKAVADSLNIAEEKKKKKKKENLVVEQNAVWRHQLAAKVKVHLYVRRTCFSGSQHDPKTTDSLLW